MKKDDQKDENQLHKDKVAKNTVHLDNEEIERMPDSEDDYRLPRILPEEQNDDGYKEFAGTDEDAEEETDDLIDEDTDISPTEIALLEEAERDNGSDETRASDILDDVDEDGDRLNEGPDEDNLFDTGADLDMPDNALDPDPDIDDEKD